MTSKICIDGRMANCFLWQINFSKLNNRRKYTHPAIKIIENTPSRMHTNSNASHSYLIELGRVRCSIGYCIEMIIVIYAFAFGGSVLILILVLHLNVGLSGVGMGESHSRLCTVGVCNGKINNV